MLSMLQGRWVVLYVCLLMTCALILSNGYGYLETATPGVKYTMHFAHRQAGHVGLVNTRVQETINGTSYSPVKVVIIAEGRSGSTFTGELFNRHQNAFYFYEPLAGIAKRYFGEESKKERSNSAISKDEALEQFQNRSVGALLSMLDCDFDSLFPEKTGQPTLIDFTPAQSLQIQWVLKQCLSERVLWKLGHYHNAELGSPCSNTLTATCHSKEIRAIKTIRMRVKNVENLLIADPNIYVIFLTRDPRGTAHSKRKLWMKNLSMADFLMQVTDACTNMAEDYLNFLKLSRIYPNRLYHLRYEDMAYHPIENAEDIYKMLGYSSLPREVAIWIKENTQNASKYQSNQPYHTTRNSSEVVYAWRQSMSQPMQKKLAEVCKPVLDLLNYEA